MKVITKLECNKPKDTGKAEKLSFNNRLSPDVA